MPKDKQKTPSVLFPFFAFILIFTPLAFGTVELWSLAVMQASVCLLVLLIYWCQFKTWLPAVYVPGLLPLLLLILWMGLQIVPLPAGFIKMISPHSFEAYQPVLQLHEKNGWIPLSVNIKATLYETLRVGSYVLFYFATVQILTSDRKLNKTVKIVVGLAVVTAFVAIIQKFTSPDHIYWLRPGPKRATLMGPWINKNQFAGFMTMLLPLAMALFLYYRPVVDAREPLRVRVVEFLSSPRSNYQFLIGFGVLIILLSVLLSLSRGGIIVALLSVMLFYFFLSRKKHIRSWPILLVMFLAIALFFYNFGFEGLFERVNQSFTSEGSLNIDRLQTWGDTFGIIKDFWLTGTGFGTFVDIFPIYKTISSPLVYDHAHNEYLEILADGGLIGFILIAWFVLTVLRHGWSMIRKRRDNFSILMGIGALVGICSMLLYSITDFNMHNGADGLYFFFLCGLLISSVNTRFHYRNSSTLLGELAPRNKLVVFCAVSLILAGIILFPMRAFLAGQSYEEVEKVYISRQLSHDKLIDLSNKMQDIRTLDPLEGSYLSILGNIEKYLGNEKAALNYYLTAARKMPLRGDFLQQVALMLPNDNNDRADALMELSYRRSLKKDALMLNFAEWLLWRGNKERAVLVLKEGLANNSNLLGDAILLLNGHFTKEEVAEILPAQVVPWIRYGTFLDSLGDTEQSEFFRKGALEFIEGEKEVQSSWYAQLSAFYMKQRRTDEAAEVLRRAVEKFPENVSFHVQLGDYYRSQGIQYRAIEEYEQAQLFDPENENIKEKLMKMGK